MGKPRIIALKGRATMTREDWRRSWPAWLRRTAIGWPLGAVPVGGAEIPTFLSYAVEKKLTKYPEQFGHGAIEGVAGPEATNNANAAGALMPLLTLGLPTSATAAVILVAFQQYGLQPGPLLLQQEPDLVWGLVAALLIGNLMLLILNLPLVGLWAKVLHAPTPFLYAGTVSFAVLGAYSLSQSVFDVITLPVLGILGYAMRQYGHPIAPLIIGAILGSLAEQQLRRALAISDRDPVALVSSPFSIVAYLVVLAVLLVPAFMKRWERRTAAEVGVLNEFDHGISDDDGDETAPTRPVMAQNAGDTPPTSVESTRPTDDPGPTRSENHR